MIVLNTVSEYQDDQQPELQNIYSRLMAVSSGLANTEVLAKMLASVCVGDGAMPSKLGLSKQNYTKLTGQHFPGAELPIIHMSEETSDTERYEEQDDLRELLLEHRNNQDEVTEWMADVLVQGCMGGNHLWQDLGLWSRKDLTVLIENNFSDLARKNNRDMKWKKFFYKQLCQREGVYVCRSPSCEVCPDYSDCFAPEE